MAGNEYCGRGFPRPYYLPFLRICPWTCARLDHNWGEVGEGMGHGHYGNLSQSIRRTFWRPRSPLPFRGCSQPRARAPSTTWGPWNTSSRGPWQLTPAQRPPIGPCFAPRSSSQFSYRDNFPALGFQQRSYSSGRGISSFDDTDMKRNHDGSYSMQQGSSANVYQTRYHGSNPSCTKGNPNEECEPSTRENSHCIDGDVKRNHYSSYTTRSRSHSVYQPRYRGRNSCYGTSNLARSKEFEIGSHGARMTQNDSSVDLSLQFSSDSEDVEDFSEENAAELLEFITDVRQWEYTPFGKVHVANPGPGLSFTVMTYNILAQQLLDQNWHLYKSSPRFALPWEYRKEHLMRELEQAKADIVCLQEVERETFHRELHPLLRKWGYQGRYKQRTGGKCDGCAMFYKEDVFVLERWQDVEYRKQSGAGVLNRDNIALIMLLRPRDERKSESKVCVATTHLLFNPGRGDIKLAQVRLLLAELDKYAFRGMKDDQTPLYYPVIMCGDMNSEPHGNIYNFLSSGHLTYEGLTAGRISGQKEGLNKGMFLLQKELIPAEIGVSDHCQYMDIHMKRMKDHSFQEEPELDLSSPVVIVDQNPSSRQDPETPRNQNASFASGTMSHGLNLLSAYEHDPCKEQDDKDVTTHHSKASCTVDYIFYSVDAKVSAAEDESDVIVHKEVKEGDLKLLATYKLLKVKDMQKLGGLPNAAQPSDHLPLVAEFLLQGR